MRNRGFEPVITVKEDDVKLPTRSTKGSAGYDFYAAEDVIIPSVWSNLGKPKTIFTNVKAYMKDDEVLLLYNRSSNPIKRGLVVANSVGVIDSDYYSNKDNDGNIGITFYNFYPLTVKIKKGEKIFQGVFQKFLKADNDSANGHRIGGYGSTGVTDIIQ